MKDLFTIYKNNRKKENIQMTVFASEKDDLKTYVFNKIADDIVTFDSVNAYSDMIEYVFHNLKDEILYNESLLLVENNEDSTDMISNIIDEYNDDTLPIYLFWDELLKTMVRDIEIVEKEQNSLKKYELTDETIVHNGRTLYRIRALKDFGFIEEGELGGFVQGEHNLSHYGDCWIYDNAQVRDNAKVFNNAEVRGNARVGGNAIVCNNARASGNAIVCDNARVGGNAKVCNNARVCDNARVGGNAYIKENAYITSSDDLLCVGQLGSRNDYTTFYLDKDKNIHVSCGCFNGTIEEFENKVEETHGDNCYGVQYKLTIDYAKSILNKFN